MRTHSPRPQRDDATWLLKANGPSTRWHAIVVVSHGLHSYNRDAVHKVTLDDIARETQLSRAAVGFALSKRAGNTRISKETRQRVLEVAQRMNYQSHAGARALRTSRFDNVGYFVAIKTPWDYAFTEIILHGLSEGATRHGKNIVMVQISQSATEEIPKSLRERCLDALIIFEGATFLPGFQAAVEASGIPAVYMNEKQGQNCLYVDDVETGRLVTSHLVERGFRKIAMLAPQTVREHYSARPHRRLSAGHGRGRPTAQR